MRIVGRALLNRKIAASFLIRCLRERAGFNPTAGKYGEWEPSGLKVVEMRDGEAEYLHLERFLGRGKLPSETRVGRKEIKKTWKGSL